MLDADLTGKAQVGAIVVNLLGDNFATSPGGFAGMLSDILLDGLVIQPEG